jgi:hypothetical protein
MSQDYESRSEFEKPANGYAEEAPPPKVKDGIRQGTTGHRESGGGSSKVSLALAIL